MHGGSPKPFYPALMDMPSLTPEARAFILREADLRIGTGTEAITSAQFGIHRAMAAGDVAAEQSATAGVREGLMLFESGASALQGLNEGQQPRQIALTWFKRQLDTPSAGASPMIGGPWDLSWYHVTTMAFLLAFLAWALLDRLARSRRVGALVERLRTGAPASAPAAAAKPPAPTEGAGGTPRPATQEPAPARKRPWRGTLRVTAVFVETPTVKTFRLMDPARGAVPFGFLPGQYLTFSAEIAGRRVSRAYTIASSPAQRDYVELTVKREELGSESRHLHDHVAAGDLVEVAGPSGAFTFTGKEADGIVLIGGGVGVTPMMCVVRWLTDQSYPGDIFLLYGIGSPEQFIFRQEVQYLQGRHPNLHVAVTAETAGGASWAGAIGRISRDFIARSVPGIAGRRVHVCGPPPMMEAVKAALDELGVPAAQVKSEAFGPARGMEPVADAFAVPETAPTDLSQAPERSAATANRAPAGEPKVEFSKSGKTGPLAEGQCVLEAAEAIGVSIDFECRVGTCGRCKVPLMAGTVTMEVEEGLPPEDKARGIVLACQAKSTVDLVIGA